MFRELRISRSFKIDVKKLSNEEKQETRAVVIFSKNQFTYKYF